MAALTLIEKDDSGNSYFSRNSNEGMQIKSHYSSNWNITSTRLWGHTAAVRFEKGVIVDDGILTRAYS